jgi:NodT family efflux transporter outer membrane factor (OMF) lipoprotein
VIWIEKIRGRVRAGALAAVTAGVVLTAGCAVGPHYSRPTAPVPTAYKETPEDWKVARPADQMLRGKWWEIYQDPALSTLEEKASVSNQSIQAADAQFRQARDLVREYRANYYPTISAGGSASRNRLSENRPLRGISSFTNYTDLNLPEDVSYEADLWGRVRRTVESARANAQASAADLESLRLSVHAELAIDYFEARALDSEIQLLNSTVAAYQKALDLTQNRYHGGIASQVDVAQAETQLQETRAQLIDLSTRRAQYEHAIAILLGEPPANFALPAIALNVDPPAIPPGLPSDLLERRPDIAAAERRMVAANAQIGIARAAYFPALSLSGSAGFESTAITSWLSGPSGFAAVGLSAMETVFDGGRRRAISDQARAAYDQSVANYRQDVLTSFQEVEDNLAALRILEKEAQTQNAAVQAAERSLALSVNRYRGGVASYLEVITAQSAALVNERTAVQISALRMMDSVLLIKALGGGWNSTTLPTVQLPVSSSSATGQ